MRVVDVAIVGAGFAGLAMAGALRRAGRDDIVVLERADDVGGTWRDNTYPGVACDVPAHLYSLAAHPNPHWTRTFAAGGEIQRYLRDVAVRENLGERLRLRTPLLGARWDADRAVWHLDTGAEPVTARSLVLACGRLTEPHVPAIEGLESFDGALFHSARWDHDVDLAGKRVAVVGTGASAVQLVPELAGRAAHVTLFQRTPAWIVPRGGGDIPVDERERLADHPGDLARLRAELYAEGEQRFASRSGEPAASAAAREIALDHLHAQVADPALRDALTPDYAFGCKRVLLSDAFYPAVASDAVTLEPTALVSVEGSTLVAASGARHDADVLVLATGFASAQQPYADLVHGEEGTLAAHWSDGMTSFGSTVVVGFPNLFVLNGPNASLGHNSAVLMAEEQAAYVVRALCERDRRPDLVLRVRPDAETAYTDEIAAAAASTPWLTGGCRNWYVDHRSGRLTLLWPGTVQAFHERLAGADGSEFEPARTPVTGSIPTHPHG
ncbi:Predicted flavoprotein CzcO associated with the cation diffusion facilitator CzcD [Microbacterium sp. ru370.1]|uniref:flavin-containing monooxygenase n=1 Tax=unclassified Microbacterium TaxID=2609290 RepID=UPI00088CE058|nr:MULTISPECIES: NAD(P)/FAD-dependent oxidoreductase [unclassified Microbacterium]SDO29416.1 Predicted flavoprotein CzcO associated with the cation diffusion facilitator CzcD [Microbacterium sp. ru370.1]SIT75587.1 Predicted flavoprotein CzcO associated with the cation diffusion facilitator CzcD [Microbacterium sp. RU1D]